MDNLYEDVQYSVLRINLNIALTVVLAFIAQSTVVVMNIKRANLGLLDYYVLNNSDSVLVETIIGWGIPLFVALLCGYQFAFFNNVKYEIFTRIRQRSFICKRALKSFFIGFVHVFMFYIMCFILLLVTMLVINPHIDLGVSYSFSSLLSEASIYFSHPYLYVFTYVMIISLFGGLFALIGFVASLFTANKTVILLTPMMTMTFSLLVFERVNILKLLNYNNYIALGILRVRTVSNIGLIIFGLLIQIGLVAGLVYKKANKDLI